MNKAAEQAFEKIAQAAIKAAEAVKCSFDDFIAGLESIYIEVKDRHSCALSERPKSDDDEQD